MVTRKVLLLYFMVLCSTVCYSQKPRSGISGDHLIKTRWSGSEPFNSAVPGGHTLGCHSVAIAQVLFHHKLIPHGTVEYQCSNDLVIERDFTGYDPDLDSLALSVDDLERRIALTSEYLFNTAAIIKKDFGTEQYLESEDHHKSQIEFHFSCQYKAYPKAVESDLSSVLKRENGFYSIIFSEIAARRPAGFYYSNNKGGGHAVVIDGCQSQGGKIYVHANFGWGGKADGWYCLEEDLPKDLQLVLLITIKPDP